ncbi:MAG: DUF4349 domain-containing protein [Candidatus Marinimicrobia bacterium]|nr:DUF4349 domain-containing protein [Candidatus Neomarinimicrobiota bacterium]
MKLKNKAQWLYNESNSYQITVFVVLILLVLFIGRNFFFSSLSDPSAYENEISYNNSSNVVEKRYALASNQYMLEEVLEEAKAVSQRNLQGETNAALALTNFFVPTANASEHGLVLIKTGSLNFAVKDFDTAYKSIITKIHNSHGYIVNEYSQESKNTNLEIKVPIASFHKLFELIEQEADQDYLITKSVRSQDVTEEYFDVETRIKSKKAIESRYLDILSMAKNVEEILMVESQLGNIRTEIEQAEGRLQYLKNRSNYSTINLAIYEFKVAEVKPTKPIEKPSLASKIKDSIIMGWGQVESLLLLLISNWFAILLALGVGYYAKRKYLKHRSK